MFSFFSTKKLKRFIAVNRQVYILSLLLVLMGLILGVVLVATDGMDAEIYSSVEVRLSEIIINDYSHIELFLASFYRLILPLLIIFVFTTNRFTAFLSYIYLFYQSLLLGGTIAGLVGESGVSGALNALILVIPINILNFFIIISGTVIFFKRLKLARLQNLKGIESYKIVIKKILILLLMVVLVSIVYGYLYPLLLGSVVVVNY